MSSFPFSTALDAQARIEPFIHRTPVLTCSAIDTLTHAEVFFKCENFQRTGSFKFRGACNAVALLTPAEKSRGVVTHSSGNHAQALALAAKLHNVRAFVVVPEDAPQIKQQAIEGYGATLIPCAPTLAARRDTAAEVMQNTGAVFIDSHDNEQVIAGQATATIELIEQMESPDLILAPVGGGGLLSGTAVAASCLLPSSTVIGCEPAEADDAYRSLETGTRITDIQTDTVADGLRTTLGERTFSIIRELVSGITLVSEDQIRSAMRLIWERMKILIEPSSAVAVAALLETTISITGKRVAVILSGGNVDLDHVDELLSN